MNQFIQFLHNLTGYPILDERKQTCLYWVKGSNIQLNAILLRAVIELFDDNNVNLGEATQTAKREDLTTIKDN